MFSHQRKCGGRGGSFFSVWPSKSPGESPEEGEELGRTTGGQNFVSGCDRGRAGWGGGEAGDVIVWRLVWVNFPHCVESFTKADVEKSTKVECQIVKGN